MLTLLWGALAVAPALGDPARYHFTVWTTENGLPHNSIQAIHQTRDGYLWLATPDGLVRFDGVRFTVFNTANTKGIRSNRFTCFFEDDTGALWIGTGDGSITCYRQGAFVTYTTADGVPDDFISGLQADESGDLFIATARGIVRWREGKFLSFASDGSAPLKNQSYLARTNIFCYHDESSLHVLNHGRWLKLKREDGLPSFDVTEIFEDRQGAVWIATKDAALTRLYNGACTVFTPRNGLPANYAVSFVEDRQGALWIGTQGSGLVRFKDGQFRIYTSADGLSGNIVMSLCEDREGNIWVGTGYGGLDRLNEDVIATFSTRDGLAANNIYPIFEDRSGDIWIGHWPMGVSRYSRGHLINYKGEGDEVTAFAEDRDGRIWVGAYGGVRYFKDGKFTYFASQIGLPDRTVVSAIYQDRQGAFWFGTNQGLRRYEDGTLKVYTTADGLPGNDVRAIIEDRQGQLWIGTYSGLARLKDGVLTSYTERDGLGGHQLRALYEDAEDVIWIGSYDGGLTRLKDGRFTAYTTREGLFNNGVFQILEDGRGNFWMSSNLGIYRVSRRQLEDFAAGKAREITCIPYGRQDGMLNIECNGGTQPAGVRTRDGKLWFPTQEGIAIIDPAAVPLNPLPPPVMLEEILIDRAAVEWRGDAGRLEIGPDRESIEIHYTGLSFIKPEQISFRYRLEGLDRDWIDAGTRRTVYYSHLPPGRYRFTIIAANSDGVWNLTGASIDMVVIPPFWRTWWFSSLVIISLAVIAVMLYRRRVAVLKRAHAAQEAFSRQLIESQENERKRIAAELHDSLGQSLSIIMNRATLALNKPEDQPRVLDQVGEIASAASEAIKEVREVAYNLRPVELDRLGLTKALQAMVKKVSASTGINIAADIDRIDDLFTNKSEINLYRIVQESVNNIVKHSGASEAKVEIKRLARGIQVVIHDDGKGFIAGAHQSNEVSAGFGLMGIAERARMLGGKHLIQSAPGRGTTINLTIGMQEARHE